MSACPSPGPESSTRSIIDLTVPAPLSDESARVARLMFSSELVEAIRFMTEEEAPRKRMPQIAEIFRKLDTSEAVEFLKAAAKLTSRHDDAGLRLLFGFLEVKRPGAEVLRQLSKFASLGRVSLRVVGGSWNEPEDTADEDAVFKIMEVLEEATKLGVIDLGLEKLPRRPDALVALIDHLRNWFWNTGMHLESGRKIPDEQMNFVTQLAMLEIHLAERRVSRLASAIDPYDARGIARLMPILSSYDQDIEHLKNVVSRLATYKPFYERLLSMESTLSASEVDKIQKKLKRDPVASCLGTLLETIRKRPVLDRELCFMVSLIHQVETLRAAEIEATEPPEILATILRILENYSEGEPLDLFIEPEIADAVWPVVETWAVAERIAEGLRIRFREDRGVDFVRADGTPRLPEVPETRAKRSVSLKELVLSQLTNDAFVLGVLNNARARTVPGLVTIIAIHNRSPRVLDKIISARDLHSGQANKDVPRLILQNPARTPITRLKSFINERYVTRVDLERMARSREIRPEVRSEIQVYLKTIKS